MFMKFGMRLTDTNALTTGVSFRKVINGVLCERVSIDGVWATIDGQPVYMEVSFRKVINGVLCERVSIDGVWATIDGQPVYMEV